MSICTVPSLANVQWEHGTIASLCNRPKRIMVYIPPVIVFVAVKETVPLKKRMIFDEADDQATGPQAPSISFRILRLSY